ncbi:RND family efflux transporter MFP subunit [Mesorhizobium soli]|uniref:efflux RND transporter periplasmic adaptor subunit n=1 Tax=Pseudaminobacter soli (ex Li et al. 2025) TaxID=1295366 RepID=UPI002476CF4A|nr:efflux RND transporter periplasmic adaptor subunit [Mesorhizobium soli]MDH6233267.1 RND family efflux transporter MFP subunit [Mesorhizobium soli]
MNTLTEQDRKLAETLKSLSLEPLADASGPNWKIIRWIAGLVLVATPISAVLIWPSSLNDIKTALLGQSEPAKPESQANPATALRAITGRDNPSPNPNTPEAVTREITGSGYVIAPRSTTVFSKYEGRIAGIAVEVGDQVQAGQILVTLEDASASLALEQARAAKVSTDLVLASREIALTQATASFRRTQALVQRDATSKKDLENAETAWKSALNSVEQARQDVIRADLTIGVAREQVDELVVRAPFAGTVAQLNAHIGDTVLARADSVRESQSLLALTDTTSMVIDADIAETNVSLLRSGLRGEAALDGFPDRPFGIELRRVAPIASAEKGTIGLRLSLINPPAGIRPNMAARIRITAPEIQSQIGEVQP